MALVDELMAKFQVEQDQANAANEKRYEQGNDIFDQIIERYQTGGSFEQATEAGLKRGEEQSIAQGTQSLVSSGLSNTTNTAGLSKKFQEEVAAPARLRAADIANERLTAAQQGKIGFIERREDTGPGYDLIANLARSVGAGGQAYTIPTGGGGGGTSNAGSFSSETSLARQAYDRATHQSKVSAEKSSRLANTAAVNQRFDAAQRKKKATSQSYSPSPYYSQSSFAGQAAQTQPDIVKQAYTAYGQNTASFKNYF